MVNIQLIMSLGMAFVRSKYVPKTDLRTGQTKQYGPYYVVVESYKGPDGKPKQRQIAYLGSKDKARSYLDRHPEIEVDQRTRKELDNGKINGVKAPKKKIAVEDSEMNILEKGDIVIANQDMYYGFRDSDEDVIEAGDELTIDFINDKGELIFDNIPTHYGGFKPGLFTKYDPRNADTLLDENSIYPETIMVSAINELMEKEDFNNEDFKEVFEVEEGQIRLVIGGNIYGFDIAESEEKARELAKENIEADIDGHLSQSWLDNYLDKDKMFKEMVSDFDDTTQDDMATDHFSEDEIRDALDIPKEQKILDRVEEVPVKEFNEVSFREALDEYEGEYIMRIDNRDKNYVVIEVGKVEETDVSDIPMSDMQDTQKYIDKAEARANDIVYNGMDTDVYFPDKSDYRDTDKAIEEALDTDGWIRFMNSYDGNYEETESGPVYWRTT